MTIKELEQQLEIPRATIRFYERENLIAPKRGENSYREYSEDDVVTLKKIIILRKIGLSVSDIKNLLEGAISVCKRKYHRSCCLMPNMRFCMVPAGRKKQNL